ncbi:carbon monoxide dehydrogenase subunit G [Microbispora sp. RL4-1S]|uniref:Carbon monoxide dehydrogenase subunit G n=1 Tax=Microbispora oryzae TaxID=2806554 RepID=A0A941AR91_9ACTN|nr:carbon monoxide dehydrogenase subunit G [Microbispora oryzae]MBP2705689.1 carbon monoxide dehydrogenase subunit G [Microbispora oryzae]
MKVVGSALLGVERKRVWDALQDPAVLVRTIPGCQRLEAVGDDVYAMTVTAGVASIKGVYQGEIVLAEPEEPRRFTLRARGQGAPGTVEATVSVRLSEAEGGTRVEYDADAVVGGMIGGVGQRLLGSVAKRTAGEFFAAVERHLRSAALAPAAPVQVGGLAAVPTHEQVQEPVQGPVQGPRVFAREEPVKAPRPGVPAWTMLAAFGMGSAVALGSAVIGWLLGRSARRR